MKKRKDFCSDKRNKLSGDNSAVQNISNIALAVLVSKPITIIGFIPLHNPNDTNFTFLKKNIPEIDNISRSENLGNDC